MMNRFNKLKSLRRAFSSVSSAKKAIKNESSVYKSFFGELDKDFLSFPRFINANLYDNKYEAIRRDFRANCSDFTKLKEKGILLNTESFSTFDLVRYFEAIGCSLNYKSDHSSQVQLNSQSNSLIKISDKLVITKRFLEEYNDKKSFTYAILPILIQNALVVPAINGSSSTTTEEVPNEPSSQFKTAFAFCELNEKFTSLPYSFWSTTATFDEEEQHWKLTGSKNRILKGDYEKYLVFCRLNESTDKASSSTSSSSSPQTGVVAFLLSADEVSVENDGTDNYGNEYLRIEFANIAVTRPATILATDEIAALNVKAKGQLSVAALIYGVIRQIFSNAITQFGKQKGSEEDAAGNGSVTAGSHQLIVNNLSAITAILYSLESTLYHTTAQFDAYDNSTLDLYLQAMIVKTLASEYSALILNELRLMFSARELSQIMSGETMNVLNVLDSFLESSISNRLLLAANGLRSVGQWKVDHLVKLRLPEIYANYFFKINILNQRQGEHRTENSLEDLKQLKSLLDSRLHESADQFEKVMDKLRETANQILFTYGKKAIENQIDMYRLASIAMSAYQMLAVIGRTNNVLNDKQRPASASGDNSCSSSGDDAKGGSDQYRLSPEDSLALCYQICAEHAISVKQNSQLVFGILDTSEEHRSATVHKRNLRFGGYFPASVFDRCV